jgi:hypothetical protein
LFTYTTKETTSFSEVIELEIATPINQVGMPVGEPHGTGRYRKKGQVHWQGKRKPDTDSVIKK